MDRMISYCGLVCTDCEAYIATRADDRAALERVVEKWRAQFNAPQMRLQDVICDGCVAESKRHCSYWYECDIRACAAGRGVANCAHCDDYACEKLEGFLGFAPEARALLDKMRAELAG